LRKWHDRHQTYLDERTVAANQDLRKRQWRYTHARLRSTFRQLNAIQDDLLRSCYRPSPELPGNTNYLEGGINSQLRTLLKYHRGMPYEHQMKLVERYLYNRTEVAKLASVFGPKTSTQK
jgi:hypothetical protein